MARRKRDSRTYITVHDGMPEHAKIEALSDEAFRLLITLWCWCSRSMNDGHIKATSWGKRGSADARQELLDEGLAEVNADGSVQMHDYTEHQRTAEEIRESRINKREAGRKGGKASAQARAQADAQAPAAPPAQAESKQNSSSVSVSVSEQLSTQVSSSGHLGNASDETRSRPVSIDARKLSRSYTDKVGMVDKAKVALVVKSAQFKYSDDQITDALDRLGDRPDLPLTIDVLRIEIETQGKPRVRPNGTDQRVRDHLALAARLGDDHTPQIGAT